MVDVDGNEVKLTRRQAEMVALLCEGLTYKEMGTRLGISWQTVRGTLHGLYAKLGLGGANARVMVVLMAYKNPPAVVLGDDVDGCGVILC